MAISSILFSAIFASLFVSLTVSETLSPIDYQTPSSCSDQSSQKSLACEMEEAKLKIARLESILDKRIAEVDAKSQHFRDCEKKIDELTAEIDRLKTAVSSFEHDYSRANLKLSALEEQVRLLWAASEKYNFEIHALEYKALDAESRLKEVTSQVEEMTEIVSEQWIQIQQLEQAVHMAEIRTSKIRKELWRRCPFVKFFVTLFGDCLETLKGTMDPYVPRDGSLLVFCKSQASQTFAAAKHYHHQIRTRPADQNPNLTSSRCRSEPGLQHTASDLRRTARNPTNPTTSRHSDQLVCIASASDLPRTKPSPPQPRPTANSHSRLLTCSPRRRQLCMLTDGNEESE